MYSVFLVEDEIVIREGIRKLVAWEEHGFSLIGEAPDGELAWPSIQKLKPDIVVTDIKMPFMDGLALSRLIKKELPNTIIIILSGHDDFSYAKEAINIGVNDYLLKPLSKDQIVSVLRELKEEKDKALEKELYNARFAREVQEYLSSSRRGFFEALVSGERSASELLERAEKLDLNLIAERYNIILFLLEENMLTDNYSSCVAEVQDEINQFFSNSRKFVMFSAGMDVTALLIKGDQDDIIQRTRECVAKLDQICTRLEGKAPGKIIAGEPVTRLSSVAECYRSARKALFQGASFVMQEGAEGFLHAGDSSTLDFDPDRVDAEKMNAHVVEVFLSNGIREDIDDFVQDYFAPFNEEDLRSALFCQHIILNIQFAVNGFLKHIGVAKNRVEGESKKEKMRIPQTLEGMKPHVVDILTQALKLRDSAAASKHKGMLQEVIAWLSDNFTNPDINLNTVAKIANVSSTHFSSIFSQEMGKTFVEYLTELRMQKARELLRCTTDGSGEIALKVGYNDPHYFSFLFKKVNHCSPRDYRNRKQEQN